MEESGKQRIVTISLGFGTSFDILIDGGEFGEESCAEIVFVEVLWL